MGFGFDGSLVIPRNPSVSTPDAAIDCFNRVKAALLLGGVPLNATNQSMIAFGELKKTGYFRYTRTLGAEAQIARALQERGAGSLLSIDLIDSRALSEEEIVKAFEIGQHIFEKFSRLNPEFLTRSFASLWRMEARDALIVGWVACEQVIEQYWVDLFLKDKASYRLSDRRKRLAKAQNVAQKMDLLLQSNLISEELYLQLSAARKGRNDFAHKGGAVDIHVAEKCAMGLVMLITEYLAAQGITADTKLLFSYVQNRESHSKSTAVNGVQKAADVDWRSPKFWRPVFAIPGDENWNGSEELVDGIELYNPTDDGS